MQVEVIRSAKRHKTVSAREIGGVLRVSIPASMSVAEEQHWVSEMSKRLHRRRATDEVDLSTRASNLSYRYGLGQPTSIRWADNQQWRWGSCTPADGTIRISTRLVGEPTWVLDYVIVHELVHLDVPGHNQEFWVKVGRYPKTELARGFLIARSMPRTEGANGAGSDSADQDDPKADDEWFDDPPEPDASPGSDGDSGNDLRLWSV